MAALITNKFQRASASLVSAGIGGFASMGFLRLLHPWAYKTEFKFWTLLTGIHCVLIFIFLIVVFGHIEHDPAIKVLARRSLASVLLGGLIVGAWFPWGTIIVITGQAFITSFAATLACVCLAFRQFDLHQAALLLAGKKT